MATQKLVVEGASVTGPQWKELVRQVVDDELKGHQVQAIVEHRNPFAPPQVLEVDIAGRIAWWLAHYKKFYGMNLDLSELVIPERQPDFDFLVLMAKGFKMSQWVEAANRIHGVYLDNSNLDVAIPKHDRNCLERSYAIWIRDRREADEELKNLSANTLSGQKVAGITAPERLVAGSAYLLQNGRHMDEENVTLCSGSRHSDGRVPNVNWRSDFRRVCVYACSAGDADDHLRSRAVVSC